MRREMELTADDYEYVLAMVEAFHRVRTLGELRRALRVGGGRLSVQGWLEAEAPDRWAATASRTEWGERAPWCGMPISPPLLRAEEMTWRSSGTHALALGWLAASNRWIGWWMSPDPPQGEVLARRLMPALGMAYQRIAGHGGAEAALTARETEVTRWIAEGKTDPEIGRILGISPRTVNKHRDNIFAKVGVATRAGLAAWFARR
jgi:DNA-binding CsgD family transcriptional regulator